jgi:hypothetical protein
MIVKTDYVKEGDCLYNRLKESDEPCVALMLLANAACAVWSIADEMDEAVLLPASWFESIEERIAALEEKGTGAERRQGATLDTHPRMIRSPQDAGRTIFTGVSISEKEKEGLDLASFKALVKEKLQAVGDRLLAAWKEEHPDG